MRPYGEPYVRKTGWPVRHDGGSATVWALAIGLVVILAAATLAAIGSATVARHRAQTAADLAALAAALRAFEGEAAACARLVACRLDGFDVIVTVEVAVRAVAGLVARRSARAGPVDE